jgi:dehydrogenase/reductase SDR family member 7
VGASQGLGEALALHWAAQGARLILSSRSLDKLTAVRAACLCHLPPDAVELVQLDLLGSADAIETAAASAYAAFDGAGVDYIIHNAGASQHAVAEETTPEVATALINLNLLGPISIARATLPRMLAARRGRHVIVASMSAVVPSPGQSAYAAAKAGLRAYFHSVTTEVAGKGHVGCTLCCPGPLHTGGGEGAPPRVVYGASGLVSKANTGLSGNRVPASRAAELIARAAWHELDEVWIAHHPVLLMGYLMQYLPASLGMKVLKKVGPARAAQLRDGSGSGYDVGAMLRN